MSIAIFLVTHEGIATHLIETAAAILKKPIKHLDFIEVPMDSSVKELTNTANQKLKQLNRDNGLIVLTDLYGSTPSNIAQTIANTFHGTLISGVNLPMLLRLINYQDDNIETLALKAIEGGKMGIQQH